MQALGSIADKHAVCAPAQFPQVWWVDPAGAILISAYIIFSWAVILRNQARLVPAAACCQRTAAAACLRPTAGFAACWPGLLRQLC